MIETKNFRKLVSSLMIFLMAFFCIEVAVSDIPAASPTSSGSRAGVFSVFKAPFNEVRTAGVTEAIGSLFVADRIATVCANDIILVADGEDYDPIPGEADEATVDPLVITEADETMYVSTSLNVREGASTESEIIDTVAITTPVEVTGYVEGENWAQIDYNGQEAFVSTDYLVESVEHIEYDTYNETWDGSTLAKGIGTVQGPSGKETYYNMPMQGVIRIMQNQLGNYSEYWVRSDGVKMYGDYIMVAANLNVHPRGTLVETSLGTGIVCDTGEFAASNPTQIDVAVAW